MGKNNTQNMSEAEAAVETAPAAEAATPASEEAGPAAVEEPLPPVNINVYEDQAFLCRKYLTDKRIAPLLERLSAAVLFHRPENPREFVLEQLRKIKSGEETLYSEEDLKVMFGMFDLTRRGWISKQQYSQAMSILSTEAAPEPESDNISFEKFTALAKQSMADWAKVMCSSA